MKNIIVTIALTVSSLALFNSWKSPETNTPQTGNEQIAILHCVSTASGGCLFFAPNQELRTLAKTNNIWDIVKALNIVAGEGWKLNSVSTYPGISDTYHFTK